MQKQGYGAYQNAQAHELDQARLILMMYAGAVRFLDKALETGTSDPVVYGDQVSRAKRVILELMASVDVETGGEMGEVLVDMYRRLFAKLNEAHIGDDMQRIREVRDSLAELEDTWRQVFNTEEYREFKRNPGQFKQKYGMAVS